MKVLILCLAFLHLARGQAFICADELKKCDSAYNQSIPNDQGDHATYCSITNTLIQCTEALAKRVQCTNNMAAINKLRKKTQENLTFHKCAGTGASTQCQANMDACERTLVAEIGLANHVVAAQCNAAQKFTTCLDARGTDPACAQKKADIITLRKKYEETFSNAGCSNNDSPRENCNADVELCESRFQNGVTKAGEDVDASCLAGAALETCFRQREDLDECKSSKKTIEIMRNSYKEQIDSKGCGSAHAKLCVSGIANCNTVYTTQQTSITTTADQCAAANTYIDCLNSVSCSQSFRGQLNQGVSMVQNMISGTSCVLKPLNGAAVRNIPVLTTVMTVVIAVYNLL